MAARPPPPARGCEGAETAPSGGPVDARSRDRAPGGAHTTPRHEREEGGVPQGNPGFPALLNAGNLRMEAGDVVALPRDARQGDLQNSVDQVRDDTGQIDLRRHV